MQLIYVHHYRHNILDIGPALYSTSLFNGQYWQYVALLPQRAALNRYLDNLSGYAEHRTNAGTPKVPPSLICEKFVCALFLVFCACQAVIDASGGGPMERVELAISKYFTLFFRVSAATATFYVVVPGILQYQAYATDAVTNRTYEAPFHDM